MSTQQEIEALEAAWLESTGEPLTSIVATTNGKLDCDYIDLSILMDVFHGGVLYGIAEQRQRADMAEEREKKLREALEAAEDFLETVLQWTGSDPDELNETQDIVRRSLNA